MKCLLGNNNKFVCMAAGSYFYDIQSRLFIRRIGYNAVSRGPQIYAAGGEMGATANNNTVINCHLFL